MKPSDREKLAEALISEHKGLKVCTNHARNVIHDEPLCPACRILTELSLCTRRRLKKVDESDRAN